MNICRLTLAKSSAIEHIISGHFSLSTSYEYVIVFGRYLALARVDHMDRLTVIHSSPVFAGVTSLSKVSQRSIFSFVLFLFCNYI